MNIKTNKKLIEKYTIDNRNLYNLNELKETLNYLKKNKKEIEKYKNENENLINHYLDNYYYLIYDLIIILNNKYKLFDNEIINLINIEFNIKDYLIKENKFNTNLRYYIFNENLFNYLLNENLYYSIKEIIIYFINEYINLYYNENDKIIYYDKKEIIKINNYLCKILL